MPSDGLAPGARYRKLEVEGIERFEGRGIYYAATQVERVLCAESEVAVCGGGNSAGQAAVYFATPHHAWERGTNENTNGLVRQYLPKRVSMATLTQPDCDAIARRLNRRPRKRLGYRTPEECYAR